MGTGDDERRPPTCVKGLSALLLLGKAAFLHPSQKARDRRHQLVLTVATLALTALLLRSSSPRR